MFHLRSVRAAAAAGLLLPLVAIAAGIFPDVTDSNPYKAEIEWLAKTGIIKGNPDGMFHPERSVNRAEFLKILYVATNRTPKTSGGCFSDVEKGSWYESYVCDAASKENAFVSGYSDGKFRPGSPVSRTEALKMIFTVMSLPVADLSAETQELIKFVDVSVYAWYTKYIGAAYLNGMLPIAGHTGSRFYPDKELLRGEAAAYIYNAMHLDDRSSSSSSSSVAAQSSVSSSASSAGPVTKNVSFPFSDDGVFVQKHSVSYLFTLKDARTVLHADVQVSGYYESQVTCRLYLIKEDGFSDEYYLGVQSGSTCTINAALKPGKYQLQIQPVTADMSYSVDVSVGTSDGNDGFMDAVPLNKGMVRTGVIEPNDMFDWYSVKVTKDQTVTIGVTGTVSPSCIIYTPPGVDQFGFTGPQCGVPYTFVAGETYIIGVGRTSTNLKTSLTYTIQWQ